MSRMMDADKFLSWLSEVEGEIRKEKMKECQPDRYDDGLMAATGTVREYVEKMCRIDEMEKKNVKKILDVTCGSRTIWFNKNHPAAVYCDIREEELTGIWKNEYGQSERKCIVKPDIQCDFTDLPFEDESFCLVVFDPPHLRYSGENSWLAKKYGRLDEHWPEILHDGFRECMRVLKEDGVLIFKWAETDIPAQKVWKAIGQRPLFGHHSGKRSNTFWGCYMKGQIN